MTRRASQSKRWIQSAYSAYDSLISESDIGRFDAGSVSVRERWRWELV
ncbi:hypothetical protein [Halobellus marinus]|nr:hypothetical protein [Halobellus sp. DFY28]